MTDVQRQQVYKYERTLLAPYDKPITHQSAIELIIEAWNDFGRGDMPNIRFTRSNLESHYNAATHEIAIGQQLKFGKGYTTKHTTIHEIAHALCTVHETMLNPFMDYGHGGTFVAVSQALYAHYFGVTDHDHRETIIKHGYLIRARNFNLDTMRGFDKVLVGALRGKMITPTAPPIMTPMGFDAKRSIIDGLEWIVVTISDGWHMREGTTRVAVRHNVRSSAKFQQGATPCPDNVCTHTEIVKRQPKRSNLIG